MKPQGRFISVGTKLAVATTALIGLVSMGVYFTLSSFQWKSMLAGRTEAAHDVMELFGQLVATPLIFDDTRGLDDSVGYVTKNDDVLFARVTSGEGATAKVAREFVRPGAEREAAALTPGVVVLSDRLVITDAVRDAEGAVIGHATLAFSLRHELTAWQSLRRQILFGAIGIALLVIVVLVLATRRSVVHPLATLTFAAERLEHGEVVTLEPSAHDEVGQLTGAFGRMAVSLKQREQALAVRNRDMKLVLDNVSQGFVVLDVRACLVGERSAIADRWFGPGQAGAGFAAWVSGGEPRFCGSFDVSWEQLSDGLMPREVCLDLLPHALVRGEQTWSLEYQPLVDEADVLTSVMVVLTDVTAQLESEAAARGQQELMEIFQRLGRDRAGFLSFVADGRRILELLVSDSTLDAVDHFRLVHTLKGNCAVQGVQSVATACHAVEGRLGEEGGLVTRAELTQLEGAWRRFVEQVDRISGADRDVVELDGALLRDLEARIAQRAPHAELEASMARWKLEPVKVRLERLAEQARALASRLGKGPVDVSIDVDDTRLEPEALGSFWSALVHVVRNAVDHGLEPAAERGEKGQARLVLTARASGGALEVAIEDDGRGIAWDRLGEKAAAKGLPHATREDLVAALFADGVSTRDGASEVSGRGVGMAAVRDVVHRTGGSIDIVSTAARGSRFVFKLPLSAPGVSKAA